MKKYFVLIMILTLLFSKEASSQTSDSTLNKLLVIDESQFINKPLDSIIAVLPPGYIEMKVYGIRNTARQLSFLYPNRVWIELHVRNFTHMSPVDPKGKWSISLMRQEVLYKTVIYKHTNCYRNCDVR